MKNLKLAATALLLAWIMPEQSGAIRGGSALLNAGGYVQLERPAQGLFIGEPLAIPYFR